MKKSVKQARHVIILAEFLVDSEEVLEAVLVESAARGGVFCCDGFGGDGAEADAPAFEDDDLEGVLERLLLVDGDPGGGGEAVALAGEEGFVVLGEGGWCVGEEGGEDGFEEGDVVGACGRCELFFSFEEVLLKLM